MANMNLGGECPNCGAIYGMHEMEWGTCGSCGYPDNDVSDDEEFDNEDAFDDSPNIKSQ